MASEDKIKSYHIFISYRVATDGPLAERLADKLQLKALPNDPQLHVTCFFDQQNLKAGEAYYDDLRRGLQQSCLFVPLISKAAISSMTKLTADSTDNVLFEYNLALKHKAEGNLDILPLYVGEVSGQTYARFNEFGSDFPDVVCASTDGSSIKSVMRDMFSLQGIFLNPLELVEKLDAIVSRLTLVTWPKYRSLWHAQTDLGPEEKKICVHCSAEYFDSTNGTGHCRFHPKNHYNGVYSCCNQRDKDAPGCEARRHRDIHHQDFRYPSFWAWARSILEDRRTVTLIQEEVDNYENSKSATLHVGLAQTDKEKGQMFIRLGDIFRMYSPQELKLVDVSKDIVYDNLESAISLKASWLLDDSDNIIGARFEGQAAEIAASVYELNIKSPDDIANVTVSDVKQISRGGIVEKQPSSAYKVPEGIFAKGKAPSLLRTRKPCWNLPTCCEPGVSLRATCTNARLDKGYNSFFVDLDMCNLGSEAVIVHSCSTQWIYYDEKEWHDVDGTSTYNNSPLTLPGTLEAKAVSELCLRVRMPEGFKLAHNRPVWLKLRLEANSGPVVTYCFEYVQRAQKPRKLEEDSRALPLFLSDDFGCLQCKKEGTEAPELHISRSRGMSNSYSLNTKFFRKLVHRGTSAGQSLVLMEVFDEEKLELHAVIDAACQRVCAIRAKYEASNGMVAATFYKVGLYGDTEKEAKPKYSSKDLTVPSGFSPFQFIYEDPPPSTPLPEAVEPFSKATASATGSGAVSVDLAELRAHVDARMDAIEQKLDQLLNAQSGSSCCVIS